MIATIVIVTFFNILLGGLLASAFYEKRDMVISFLFFLVVSLAFYFLSYTLGEGNIKNKIVNNEIIEITQNQPISYQYKNGALLKLSTEEGE